MQTRSNDLSGYPFLHILPIIASLQEVYCRSALSRRDISDIIQKAVPVTLDICPKTGDGDWFCGIETPLFEAKVKMLFPWKSPADDPPGPCSRVRVYSTLPVPEEDIVSLLQKVARTLESNAPYTSIP